LHIAYLCYWNLGLGDGVGDKINSQVRHWRTAGHGVDVLALERARTPRASGPLDEQVFPFQGARSRLTATARLARAARDLRPDLVYLRYDVFSPPILTAFRDAKLVVELNSNVTAELRTRSSAVAAYEKLQRRVLLRRANGAVAVTSELANAARRTRPQLDTTVIANGIELGAVPEARRDGRGPRLVYIGDDVYWQGVDKVIQLAERFPAWRFDLVGVGERPAPDNVVCHGFLARDAYAAILSRADVAVGTLALHRKRMEEASPLKVRRYLEFGLPLILGYIDTDLIGLESAWWLLTLPNVETNVSDSVEAIESFIDSVAGRRVPRAEVEPLIAADEKERQRLEFFERIADHARSASSEP
jgi:glycosyltransferase involved in cell wall biosynthesis